MSTGVSSGSRVFSIQLSQAMAQFALAGAAAIALEAPAVSPIANEEAAVPPPELVQLSPRVQMVTKQRSDRALIFNLANDSASFVSLSKGEDYAPPTRGDLLSLAREALASIETRKGENTRLWADRLGNSLGKMND
jgi:hypothetical protein